MPPAPPSGKRAANSARQRSELLSAACAAAADQGPSAVRVADVVAVAKLSRNTFYRHFSNVDHCLGSAAAEFGERASESVLSVASASAEAGRLARAVRALVDLAVDDPACFQTWLLAGFRAGAGNDPLASVRRDLERIATAELSRPGVPMPPEIVRALVGGLLMTLQRRVRAGQTDELPSLAPELVGWLLAYPTPAASLPRAASPPATSQAPAARDARERILDATTELVAELPDTKAPISAIAQRARISFSTFYAHFDDLETVVLAAIERRERTVGTAAVAAFRRERSWPRAVRAALHATLAALAADPATSALGATGVASGDARVLDRHARSFRVFEAPLAAGYRLHPSARRVAGEAVGSTLAGVLHDHVREGRVHELASFAPTATFIALSPFLPNAETMKVATLRFG